MVSKLTKMDTIATVWPKLTHQRKYVAPIRIALQKVVKEHGNAHVRIGITGTGQKPCYRIFYMEDGVERIVGSYWDMHQALDTVDAATESWSDASMSFEELDAFFKAATGWKS